MKLLKTIAACMTFAPLALAASGALAEDAKLPDLKGKKLVVYVTFHENEGKALLEGFKKHTNVDYSFLRISAGETVARIQAEKGAPQADIMLGGGAENHEVLKAAGLLEQYKSPVAADIPAYYQDPDGYWAAFYVGPSSIGINKDYWDKDFAPKGLALPKTYEDLLNPAFKGEIVMPDPATSGSAYTLLAGIIQVQGEEKAFEFFKKLRPQVAQYTSSGNKPAQMVGSGEYLIGLNFIHDQLLVKKNGMPMLSIVPEGAAWEIGAISVIKGGPNTESAKAFVDYVLGKEAGDIHSSMTQRLSTRSDVPVPEGATPLDQLPINKDFSFAKAAEGRADFVKKWKALD
ncbi:MAG: ABC transporter substrate-binding protein [Methylobacteriaceae bacterium]|nr:ABC transporter substrate-binding protein [Methylobacteriaceae bacterium]